MQLELNGNSFDLDLWEADNIDRALTAFQNFLNQRDNATGNVQLCELVDCFVDDVFGDGTSAKIFEGKRNIPVYMDVCTRMVEAIAEQIVAGEKLTAEVNQRMNRVASMLQKKADADPS